MQLVGRPLITCRMSSQCCTYQIKKTEIFFCSIECLLIVFRILWRLFRFVPFCSVQPLCRSRIRPHQPGERRSFFYAFPSGYYQSEDSSPSLVLHTIGTWKQSNSGHRSNNNPESWRGGNSGIVCPSHISPNSR